MERIRWSTHAVREAEAKGIVLMLTASLVLVTACQPKQVNELTTTSGTPPTTVVLASDDIIYTPAGPAYRANVHEQGVRNPFLPVQTVVVSLSGAEDLRLDYRSTIETKAGETRNNILWLYGTGVSGKQGETVIFTPEDLPPGIGATPVQTAVGPMTKAVMEIRIPAGAQAGKYSFQIRTEIDGKDYGVVSCTVEVTP